MKYMQNAAGGIQAVTDEHYDSYLTVPDDAGNRQPKPGYKELTVAQAKKAAPQLFGQADPTVVYSAKELVAKRKYAQELKEFRAADTKPDGSEAGK